jgi:hypothetical protein
MMILDLNYQIKYNHYYGILNGNMRNGVWYKQSGILTFLKVFLYDDSRNRIIIAVLWNII